MKEPGKYDECLCGSNKKAKFCCFQNGHWQTPPRGLIISSPKTGVRVEDCYASESDNCGGVLSREHLYSESVLDLVAGEGFDHKVVGLSRTPGAIVPLRPEAIAVPRLCQRHNHALSNFDDTAKIIYGFFRSLDSSFASDTPSDEFVLVSGKDFEHWLLKTACVQIASGRLLVKGRPYSGPVPKKYVDILYEGSFWPSGWGMHLIDPPEGERVLANNFLSFCLVWKEGDLVGARFILGGHHFYLQMDDFSPYGHEGHRPSSMSFIHPSGAVRKLAFGWDSGRGRYVVQKYIGQTTDLPNDKF